MNKKFVDNYVFNGLGFPIELNNVEMIEIRNEYFPKIDVKKIANLAIRSLVFQHSRLTGNQIKFIRTYFSMSLRDFSKIVNESHMAIKKWEDFQDQETNMDKNIEIMLRLHIYDRIAIQIKSIQKEKINFYNIFKQLTNIFSHKLLPPPSKVYRLINSF